MDYIKSRSKVSHGRRHLFNELMTRDVMNETICTHQSEKKNIEASLMVQNEPFSKEKGFILCYTEKEV